MSAAACRKEEVQERKEERKVTQFKERELKKAMKLLGSDFTVRRSARSKLPVLVADSEHDVL
jgi:predicted Zn-dependent peptidase